jgi:Rrf2 family iron-sulfur cluster assembly transcriptional regulator
MKVTKAEEQGLRLALSLARAGGRCGLNDLAQREQLSVPLVAKVVGKLRRGGVVKAVLGRKGRYELARSAQQITVAAVLRAVGEVLDGCNTRAASSSSTCPHATDCTIRPIWRHVEQQIIGALEQVTLHDMLSKEGMVQQQLARLPASPDVTPSGPQADLPSLSCFPADRVGGRARLMPQDGLPLARE